MRSTKGPLWALVGLPSGPAQRHLMPRDSEPQLRQRDAGAAVLNLSPVELERSRDDAEPHIEERAHQEVRADGPLVSHTELRPDGRGRDDVRAVVGAMREEAEPELQVERSAPARVPVRRAGADRST